MLGKASYSLERSKSAYNGELTTRNRNLDLKISKESVEMNMKLNKLMNTQALSGMKTINSSTILPKTNNRVQFTDLINRIEEITERPKYIVEQSPAKEGIFYEYKLHRNDKLLIFIIVLNKLCPLKVQISKSGNLIVYASSKVQDPDSNNCDRIFKSDSFYISDSKFRFKADKVHLGILATEYTEFKILFTFQNEMKKLQMDSVKLSTLRAKTARHIQRLQNNIEEKNEFFTYVEGLLENRKKEALEKARNKNFLKINLKVRSCFTKEYLRSKSEGKLRREQEVKEKQIKNYQEKLEKNKKKLMNRELRLKELLKLEQEHQAELLRRKLVKDWISIIRFFQISATLHDQFIELKVKKIKTNILASKIQNRYRRWNTSTFNNLSKEIIHSRNFLLFFHSCTKPLNYISEKKLITLLNEKVSNRKPKIYFKRFISSVLILQKYFKERINFKFVLLHKYKILWKQQISSIIKRLMKKSTKNKQLSLVLGIKDNTRDTVLKKILAEKLENKKIINTSVKTFLPAKAEIVALIEESCGIKL